MVNTVGVDSQVRDLPAAFIVGISDQMIAGEGVNVNRDDRPTEVREIVSSGIASM